MNKKEPFSDILVVGAGIAGIQASLMLSKAKKNVHLIEKTSYTGGASIKYEEVFSNMECSTCMLAPIQQQLLQDKNITLHTLSTIKGVKGSQGNYIVTIEKKARYVDMVNCIGCNACFDPCPVSVRNEFEEGLNERKAIFVPCAGALPNVPMIDTEHCLRFKNKKCTACQEACMFEAIDYNQKDETFDIKVGAIIVATGFSLFDTQKTPHYGYGTLDDVYTALEFERLYASNGPTEGTIQLKKGDSPKSAAIIHCVGRKEQGYCSSVCCLYSLKFTHYLTSKLPDIKIYNLYSDLCIPGKSHQKFYEKMKDAGTTLLRADAIKVEKKGKSMEITYTDENNKKTSITVDMVILAPALLPHPDTMGLAKTLDIAVDDHEFFKENDTTSSCVSSSKPGIYIVGCAQGPKNIQDSVTQASAAVGKILSSS